jgi:putative transcriptional regulator
MHYEGYKYILQVINSRSELKMSFYRNLQDRSAYMIRCHLSTLLGQRKLKISDLERMTGIHRNTLTLLYRETAIKVELEVIEKICVALNVAIGDLLTIE